MGCFCLLRWGNKQQTKKQERSATEARARASGATPKQEEQFEKWHAERAAGAQLEGMAKQSANSSKGAPVLKWQMNGRRTASTCVFTTTVLCCNSS